MTISPTDLPLGLIRGRRCAYIPCYWAMFTHNPVYVYYYSEGQVDFMGLYFQCFHICYHVWNFGKSSTVQTFKVGHLHLLRPLFFTNRKWVN